LDPVQEQGRDRPGFECPPEEVRRLPRIAAPDVGLEIREELPVAVGEEPSEKVVVVDVVRLVLRRFAGTSARDGRLSMRVEAGSRCGSDHPSRQHDGASDRAPAGRRPNGSRGHLLQIALELRKGLANMVPNRSIAGRQVGQDTLPTDGLE
jgi:hypothetical protein